jgi:hypothetical protein
MFLPSPEHRDGMVEAALLHAHHMFDGLCEMVGLVWASSHALFVQEP